MATVAELRELVADAGETRQEVYYGDGVRTLFNLPGGRSAAITAVTVAGEAITAYTITGRALVFTYPPGLGDEVVVDYTIYLHSTATITNVLGRHPNDIYRAASEVLLMRAASPDLMAIIIERAGYREDRSKVVAELRSQAKSYIELSNAIPAESVDTIATDIFSYNHDELLDRLDETIRSDN